VLDKFSGEIMLVSKHFPLANHGYAKKAAAAAIAANEQGKFWNYHRELLKNHKNLSERLMREIAIELGLDMIKFKRDMKSQAAEKRIKLDMKDGRDKGVSNVPSVYVNEKLLKDRSLQGFTKAISAELAKKK
jgi:protein-disulfide isomerase